MDDVFDETVGDVIPAECTDAHEGAVPARFDRPEGRWPGQRRVDHPAERGCDRRLAPLFERSPSKDRSSSLPVIPIREDRSSSLPVIPIREDRSSSLPVIPIREDRPDDRLVSCVAVRRDTGCRCSARSTPDRRIRLPPVWREPYPEPVKISR
ncbi:hypothetical protein OHA77_09710 [Streptosporangium sp. NBC_01639]|uniref:hypothetical protein n=1 Tax=Streptosporangium sp. NBC_01639 TaxID=2975948 RepID=UPI00386346B7|nr:hypothetical protein OHA77_09710 [Streptosporangium sp. NBC_01639]